MSAHILRWGLAVVVLATAGLVRAEEPEVDHAALAVAEEATAEAFTRSGDPRASRAWERAARSRARARDPKRALADIDRALELVEDDRERTDQAFWRLYLRHGMLDAEGAPTLGTGWPGDSFVEDLHATVGSLQGNREVGLWLLSLASRCMTANHPAEAYDLYMLALRDPVLVDRAREDASIWGGLLAAVPMALELNRFDEAERALHTIAGIADLPREEVDGWLLRIARAREFAARPKHEPEAEPGPAPPEAAPETPASPHRGRLLPHGAPSDGGDDEAGRATGEDGSSVDRPWGISVFLLGALAVAGVLLIATVVRSRRRRRASLGGHPTRR